MTKPRPPHAEEPPAMAGGVSKHALPARAALYGLKRLASASVVRARRLMSEPTAVNSEPAAM